MKKGFVSLLIAVMLVFFASLFLANALAYYNFENHELDCGSLVLFAVLSLLTFLPVPFFANLHSEKDSEKLRHLSSLAGLFVVLTLVFRFLL